MKKNKKREGGRVEGRGGRTSELVVVLWALVLDG